MHIPELDKTLSDPLESLGTFASEPTYHPASKLWLYGNVRLLRGNLTAVPLERCLSDTERVAEKLVLDGFTLVVGTHHNVHRQAAIVPLRWGSPRIVVFSGGIRHHLGQSFREEPFRAAKLWRHQWDARVDLAVSLRAPDSLPTFAVHNPTVDRLIEQIARKERPGLYSSLIAST